jgi:hypothetical protein
MTDTELIQMHQTGVCTQPNSTRVSQSEQAQVHNWVTCDISSNLG